MAYLLPLIVLFVVGAVVVVWRNERRDDRARRLQQHLDSRIQPYKPREY
jgi:hypothetical protein